MPGTTAKVQAYEAHETIGWDSTVDERGGMSCTHVFGCVYGHLQIHQSLGSLDDIVTGL